MKIDRVSVRYGELRSNGYPSFSNTRHEIELSAMLEPGDTPEAIREKLLRYAKQAVSYAFSPGENLPSWIVQPSCEMQIPF